MPGPGSHDAKPFNVMKKPPTYSMGMKLKSMLVKQDGPGPGTYLQPGKDTGPSAPRFSIGKSKRPPIGADKSGAPGPGSYKLNSRFANCPDYAMPSIKQEKKFV